jgi:dTDP-4-amino-4,6-dideoxygalactose transaminase
VTIPFLDLARQTASLREELDDAIGRVLSRGVYVLGEELTRFEEAFAAWCGVGYAVGVANGTDAITIALQSVGVQPGDEVITAANTCVPTIAGIENAGAIPVLADVDPETRTLNPSQVEAAIGPTTRAILPVHLYGICADLDSLAELAATNGLALVEDCAQAHGAQIGSRRAGSVGHAAAFSFYPTKNLGALGDAGAVVTSDPDTATRVRLLRNYGERERFEHVMRGRNSRLDELQAALLTVKIPHLDAWAERRRAIAKRYDAALEETAVVTPKEPPRHRHVYHLYVVEPADRGMFRESLSRLGVATAVHYPRSIHQQPAYRGLSHPEPLHVSERLAASVVSIPLYPELSDDEVDAVCDALQQTAIRT